MIMKSGWHTHIVGKVDYFESEKNKPIWLRVPVFSRAEQLYLTY